jgi:3-oxoadipate enol-lactonase
LNSRLSFDGAGSHALYHTPVEDSHICAFSKIKKILLSKTSNMPTAEVNGIFINYQLQGSGSGDLIVLVNGLADDLLTWDGQVPAFLNAGYRVLRYDNRGIGKSSRPSGPYTSEMMADDLHELLLRPDLNVKGFHLVGVSMGGMICQSYALKYPNGSPEAKGLVMLSLSLCCTYAQPTTFCSKMFALWADMAAKMSVQDVMRDVMLWAFTVPFFRQRTSELQEFEDAMEELDMPLEAYLSQLNVIQQFDTTSGLDYIKALGKVLGGLLPRQVLVLAGKTDILIPVVLSKELADRIEGAQFLTTKGGHACLVSWLIHLV